MPTATQSLPPPSTLCRPRVAMAADRKRLSKHTLGSTQTAREGKTMRRGRRRILLSWCKKRQLHKIPFLLPDSFNPREQVGGKLHGGGRQKKTQQSSLFACVVLHAMVIPSFCHLFNHCNPVISPGRWEDPRSYLIFPQTRSHSRLI